jgi:hypothetical protein
MYNAESRVSVRKGENEMRRIVMGAGIVLVLAVVAWAGGDPWKSKPFQQWDQKDVQQILQESPWAKSNLQAGGAWQPLGQSTTEGAGAYDTRSSTVMDGGAEKTKDAIAGAKAYSAYWWSSRTIRAATCRQAVLRGAMTETDAEKLVAAVPDEYEVRVRGSNMSIFEQRGEKAFGDAAWLELKKSKTKLTPSHVTFDRDPGSEKVVSVTFYFPKKDKSGNPTIIADEKEMDFFLKIGGSKLVTYFEPKKMVDIQGQDL